MEECKQRKRLMTTHSESVPHIRTSTNKVIKAFSGYDVNVGIHKSSPLVKRRSKQQPDKGKEKREA